MSEKARLTLVRDIEKIDFVPTHTATALTSAQAEQFGELLYASYKGTVDDEGETLEESKQEAKESLDGKYGPAIWEASFAISANNMLASACLVIDRQGPFMAYVVTSPQFQGKGLAKELIFHSLNALHLRADKNLTLVVTATNTPALALYRKLGFQEMIIK
ncbi:MAG: GNAT family N-acetyltransferase [Candidatus Obscuribacterales bacterium]|nr:GNAT family N-acetyltransferase [Candidatus Obscuribacterales bacterium]